MNGVMFLCFSLRVVVLDKVTDLLLFFGKLLVVGGVGKKDISELGICEKFQDWFSCTLTVFIVFN